MRGVKKGQDDFFESPEEYDLANDKFKVSSTVNKKILI